MLYLTKKYLYVRFHHIIHLGKTFMPKLTPRIAEFNELLARMQTPHARTGVETIFNASPEKLGRAAVTAAQKPRPQSLQPAKHRN